MWSDRVCGKVSNWAWKTLKMGRVEFKRAGWRGRIWVWDIARSEKGGGGSEKYTRIS